MPLARHLQICLAYLTVNNTAYKQTQTIGYMFNEKISIGIYIVSKPAKLYGLAYFSDQSQYFGRYLPFSSFCLIFGGKNLTNPCEISALNRHKVKIAI